MKKINGIIIGSCSFLILLVVGINLYMLGTEFRDSNRSYRVSTSRMEKSIDRWEDTQEYQEYLSNWKTDGQESESRVAQSLKDKIAHALQQTSNMEEIKGIYFLPKQVLENEEGETGSTYQLDEFLNDKSEDYVIYATDNGYYRITYERKEKVNTQILGAMNLIAGILIISVLGILLYVRNRIIKPFTQMSELPYELSKGNLAMPI